MSRTLLLVLGGATLASSLCTTLLSAALAPHAPIRAAPLAPRRAGSPVASALSAYDIAKVRGDPDTLAEAARFFADSFWAASTTTGDMELSDKDRDEVSRLQTTDMEARYAELMGTRRLRSRLHLARDSDGGIVGCVGVEAALIDPAAGVVLSRAQGENLINGELTSMGARERSQYRRLELTELVAELLPEYKAFALLANLAVAPSTRRSGLARELCARCEEAGREWGFPAIFLQVEESNAAARGLYSSVGYQEVFRDEGAIAPRISPGAKELVRNERVTLLGMGKGL